MRVSDYKAEGGNCWEEGKLFFQEKYVWTQGEAYLCWEGEYKAKENFKN